MPQVEVIDPVEDYLTVLKGIFDFQLLKTFLQRKDFKMVFDALHAVTGAYAGPILCDQLGADSSSIRCARRLLLQSKLQGLRPQKRGAAYKIEELLQHELFQLGPVVSCTLGQASTRGPSCATSSAQFPPASGALAGDLCSSKPCFTAGRGSRPYSGVFCTLNHSLGLW